MAGEQNASGNGTTSSNGQSGIIDEVDDVEIGTGEGGEPEGQPHESQNEDGEAESGDEGADAFSDQEFRDARFLLSRGGGFGGGLDGGDPGRGRRDDGRAPDPQHRGAGAAPTAAIGDSFVNEAAENLGVEPEVAAKVLGPMVKTINSMAEQLRALEGANESRRQQDEAHQQAQAAATRGRVHGWFDQQAKALGLEARLGTAGANADALSPAAQAVRSAIFRDAQRLQQSMGCSDEKALSLALAHFAGDGSQGDGEAAKRIKASMVKRSGQRLAPPNRPGRGNNGAGAFGNLKGRDRAVARASKFISDQSAS